MTTNTPQVSPAPPDVCPACGCTDYDNNEKDFFAFECGSEGILGHDGWRVDGHECTRAFSAAVQLRSELTTLRAQLSRTDESLHLERKAVATLISAAGLPPDTPITQAANKIHNAIMELAHTKAQVAQLKADYNSEVDEFNAGFEAAQAGLDLQEQEMLWCATHDVDYDVFAAGYAWGAFDRLRAQGQALRDAAVAALEALGTGNCPIENCEGCKWEARFAIRELTTALAPGGGVQK